MTLHLALGVVTASQKRRTLAGIGVRFGVYGRTNRGLLKVRDASALEYPTDLSEVVLTEEHDRSKRRGVLASVAQTAIGTRVEFKADDGAAGDTALTEAQDGTRAGLSFDIEDAVVEGDVIVAGRVVAFGQVITPAYTGAFFDSIAAAAAPTPITAGDSMTFTPEMAARLIELQGLETLSDEQKAELDALQALADLYNAAPTEEAAPPVAAAAPPVTAGQSAEAVTAAAVPTVPAGAPPVQSGGRAPARTEDRPGAPFWQAGALRAFTDALVVGARNGGGQAITAALADITHSQHSSIIEPPAWSGELWSGLEYEPIWTDLFSTGELTNFEGKGWRWKTKLVIKDYAGNKVEIPTSTVETEPSDYEAARMAVGVDIDRKYFDFNNSANQAFLAALPVQARESYAIKLDDKVRAYTLAKAVAAEGVGAQDTLLKAAAVAIRALRRRKVLGKSASTWVVVNDDDLFDLMEFNQFTLPAFLDLWGVDPRQFRSSQDVPAGTVVAGAKQAAEVKQLPGSPIRVDAINLARGGVDEGFFAYWAIEEHHTSGIAKATYTRPV